MSEPTPLHFITERYDQALKRLGSITVKDNALHFET